MANVDALRMVEHVRKRLVDLAVSENYVRDPSLSNAMQAVWSGLGKDGGLVSELWVEGAFPGKHSKDTLQSLSEEQLFPADLCGHLNHGHKFPADRTLYDHQSESIRAARKREDNESTFVITAGTGLGKTEAFLLPILSDLWRGPPRNMNGGMRCLILYPMNALVADQVERVYKWLRGQDKLSVFHFTSETPEDKRRADKVGEPDDYERCRMRTRQEARGLENRDGSRVNPASRKPVPDIVITNYSMLEYMLCRPQDACFFGPDLRCIVLDEAHLYGGALAAEIMMLLRRVRQRCGVNAEALLNFATSATLGGDNEDLKDFGGSLFSTLPDKTRIIRGKLEKYDLGDKVSPPNATPDLQAISSHRSTEFKTMTPENELIDNSPETVEILSDITANLLSKSAVEDAKQKHPSNPAKFLHASLREAPIIRQMADLLMRQGGGGVYSLDSLCDEMFSGKHGGVQRDTVITLLRLAASGRDDAGDLPIIPHRLHFLVRAPEGLSVCLNKECPGPNDRHLDSVGCLQPLGEKCRYCDHILLPVYRCDSCGNWALAVHRNPQEFLFEPAYFAESHQQRSLYLLDDYEDHCGKMVVVDPKTGEFRGHGAPGVSLWEAPSNTSNSDYQACPLCHNAWGKPSDNDQTPEWRRGCQSLTGGRPFALSVAAETILHDLPEYGDCSRDWKPAGGRRLLAFSDSRSRAARLGPLLTQQHEIQLVRTAMANVASDMADSDVLIDIEEDIRRYESKLKRENISEDLKAHIEDKLRDARQDFQESKIGIRFRDFARKVSKRPEMREILDRNCADDHSAATYGQSDWDSNGRNVKDSTEGLIAKELGPALRRRASVESAGLIEIVYPGIDTLTLPTSLESILPSHLRDALNSEGVWPIILSLLLDDSRRSGCIGWSEDNEGRLWLGESPLQERWLTKRKQGWNSVAFVGSTTRQTRRRFAMDVLKEAGCEDDQNETLSAKLLEAAFDQIFNKAKDGDVAFHWLSTKDHHQVAYDEEDRALQLMLDHLAVRKPHKVYQCKTTNTIWAKCVLGWCPINGCKGRVVEIRPDDLDKDALWGRRRRELRESSIFTIGLWAEEHSAQLSPQENRRIQDLFKHGIRNILSSTTTMELGVDIGGLNGVLLGNVPPGPSNHRQRAGRAGRRSDGSAVVATYSRGSEYGMEVFHRFGEFLQREMRRPTVFHDRKRLIQRHLHSELLSGFIRNQWQANQTGAMQAYGRMGDFCGIKPPSKWYNTARKPQWEDGEMVDISNIFLNQLRGMHSHFTDERKKLLMLAANTGFPRIEDQTNWNHFIASAEHIFNNAIEEWKNDVEQLRLAWEQIPENPVDRIGFEKSKANSIRYMLNALCSITVIEWLADRSFLPRYGFPINLQSLSVREPEDGHSERVSTNERYRLQRSSLLALREYVPESRVLVGGRVATSRGLRKHWTDSNIDEALGLTYLCLECPDGHVYLAQSKDKPCPKCEKQATITEQLVFPRFGYTTAGWEKLPLGTNLERIGEQSVCPVTFAVKHEEEESKHFAGLAKTRLTYQEEAPLLVRNGGRSNYGFAICTRCGFSMSETEIGNGRMDLPKGFQSHASIFSSTPNRCCWQRTEGAPVIRNKIIAAKELTDMLIIEWPNAQHANNNDLYSFGRSLVMAGAAMLELDERELGMTLMPLARHNMGIVIYDSAPGGAGHCQELFKQDRNWLKKARQVLFVDDEHHARCNRACLDCILDFSGQYAAHRLERRAALNLIDQAHEAV